MADEEILEILPERVLEAAPREDGGFDAVERAVGELIERKDWTDLSHRVIFHGRRVCHARKPACGVCVLAKDCPSVGTGPMNKEEAAALVKGPETGHLLELAGMSV